MRLQGITGLKLLLVYVVTVFIIYHLMEWAILALEHFRIRP